MVEGPILDCWTCLRMTNRCFKGEYCGGNKDRGMEFSRDSDQGAGLLTDLFYTYLLSIFNGGHGSVTKWS